MYLASYTRRVLHPYKCYSMLCNMEYTINLYISVKDCRPLTIIKLAIDGSNVNQFNRGQLRFNPSMVRLIVPTSILRSPHKRCLPIFDFCRVGKSSEPMLDFYFCLCPSGNFSFYFLSVSRTESEGKSL